jgi:anti-anti-sigma factor
MSEPQRIQTQDQGGVTIVRFKDRQLFDEPTVREVGEELLALLPEGEPCKIVLDFTGVDLVSSAMLGKLIVLQRRIAEPGGKLRICEISPNVYSVLKSTNLVRFFQTCRDTGEALEALAR